MSWRKVWDWFIMYRGQTPCIGHLWLIKKKVNRSNGTIWCDFSYDRKNLPERGVQDRGLTTLDKTTSNGLKYAKKYACTSVFLNSIHFYTTVDCKPCTLICKQWVVCVLRLYMYMNKWGMHKRGSGRRGAPSPPQLVFFKTVFYLKSLYGTVIKS